MWGKHLKRIRVGFYCLLSFVSFTPLATHADISQAVDYLITQQAVDGIFYNPDTNSTSFQSTAEAVRGLVFVGEASQADIVAARSILNGIEVRNTEYLSRLLVTTVQSGNYPQAIIEELLLHQNVDGGFGDFSGYDSTILDTAFALEALAESGQQQSAIAPAAWFLLNAQSAEGGWLDGSDEASVYLTALSMRALWHYRSVFLDVPVALANAQDFLLAQRDNTTGLWSETFKSALALIALIPNASEFSQLEAVLTELRNQQSDNGSWDNDVLTTSLALRALASQPTPLPVPITTGSISGKVTNSVTGLPIANASVIVDGTAINTSTDSTGVFTIDGLDPSAYIINIIAPGYSTLALSGVSVIVGTDRALGNISLFSLPTTGVLEGQLSDAKTSQFLQGVAVSVSGSTVASTVSGETGIFSLAGLNPGDITITLTKTGYLPLTATATITAGNTLVLNQALTATSSVFVPLPGTDPGGALRGVVTDATTGLPLSQVSIIVRDANSGASIAFVQTGSVGRYEITTLPPGDISISVGKAGFLNAGASSSLQAGNVLVFSPGLVPVGGDPSSGTGADVTQEPLPSTPTNGALQGMVTDLETSLPLAGVTISLSGSNSVSTITAADGSYRLTGLSPGIISVTASLSGYLDISGSGAVVAGNAIIFNPEMPPTNYVGNDNGQVVGRVIDAVTQEALRYVSVRIVGDNSDVDISTSYDGSFQVDDLSPGVYQLSFEKGGYVSRTYSALVTSGGIVDMQTIELSLAITKVMIFGQLLDEQSNEPIADANVSIVGTAISTQSDTEGKYSIEGLEPGTKTLTFSATGYSSQSLISSFVQGGQFEINRRLGLADSSGLNMTFLVTNQTVYEAYASGFIDAVVANTGSPMEAMVVFSMLDAQGKLVADFSGTRNGDGNMQIQFAADELVDIKVDFNTANLPPGDYRIIGRVEVGNQMVGPATVILDERVTEFSVIETRRAGSVRLESLPAYSAVGITETINVLATIQNRSNVDIQNFSIRYRILDPDDNPVKISDFINIPLEAKDDNYSLVIDSFDFEFLLAGEYAIELYSYSGMEIENVIENVIKTAPGLRIDASQTVTPATVTPDEDQRVRINIRLEGEELQ
ncbi:MAG: carboxypeptidase regulatory-like domain-containing protein [Gammaproteobacteria bacterium]|nr:carboxypeptidase regulatory-like domain-containing protein [Gammaproteobacteria bacterium]